MSRGRGGRRSQRQGERSTQAGDGKHGAVTRKQKHPHLPIVHARQRSTHSRNFSLALTLEERAEPPNKQAARRTLAGPCDVATRREIRARQGTCWSERHAHDGPYRTTVRTGNAQTCPCGAHPTTRTTRNASARSGSAHATSGPCRAHLTLPLPDPRGGFLIAM